MLLYLKNPSESPEFCAVLQRRLQLADHRQHPLERGERSKASTFLLSNLQLEKCSLTTDLSESYFFPPLKTFSGTAPIGITRFPNWRFIGLALWV